jgi:hypothetical protein
MNIAGIDRTKLSARTIIHAVLERVYLLLNQMKTIDQSFCPLCGQPNGCALAKSAGTVDDCWCVHVQIPLQRLMQIPSNRIGRACICRSCAKISTVSPHRSRPLVRLFTGHTQA